MEADHVLSTTRSVRKRMDLQRPVPREVILECLQIAVQAPTGGNRHYTDPAGPRGAPVRRTAPGGAVAAAQTSMSAVVPAGGPAMKKPRRSRVRSGGAGTEKRPVRGRR